MLVAFASGHKREVKINALSILHSQFSIFRGRKGHEGAKAAEVQRPRSQDTPTLNSQLSIFNFNRAQPFNQKVIGE